MAKNINREGTFKRRPDGRVEGQVRIVDASGASVRRSVYGKTMTEAKRKMKTLIEQIDGGVLISQKPQTVAEYMAIWSQNLDIKPSARRARDLNRRRVIPVIGSVQLGKLTPDHVRTVDTKLHSDGLSGASRNQAFDVLKAAMNEAVRERLITVSPFSRISWVPVVEHREMRFLTALEQAKLYSLNNEWTAAWQVLLATGMRSGEAFALSWKQVDLDAGRISIIQSISPKKDGYELVSPKTPQSRRTLQIAPAVVQVLRGVKERQEAEAKRLGDYWANPEQFVFTRGSGQAILPHYAYHQFMSALKEANLEHCRVHDLRHSFAADQINNGTPVLAVSRMLGHSTVAFTLQVYGHITTETQDTAASLSGRLLEEAMRTGQAMAEVVGGDRAQHDSSAVVV